MAQLIRGRGAHGGRRAARLAVVRLVARLAVPACAVVLAGCAPGTDAGAEGASAALRRSAPGSAAADARTPDGPRGPRGFVLVTSAGDTIAREVAVEGDDWLEISLHLARRAERQRIVLASQRGADVRWDVVREWEPRMARAAERWRLLPSADSLAVVQGALIGVPVNVRTLPAPPDVLPWHEASAVLLERLVRRGAAASWVMSITAPMRLHRVQVQPLGPDSVRVTHPDGDWVLRLDRSGRLVDGASPSRGLALRRVEVRNDTAHAPGADRWTASSTDEARPGVVEEPVLLRAPDGVRLAGTFTRPASALPVPVVVFVSGSGPQDRDLAVPGFDGYRPFAEFAAALAARGIGSLRMDDRGAGASGGSAYSATFADEAEDVRVQLAWLRARPDVRPAAIALAGHSDGGHVALDVAGADTALRAVLLLGTPAQSGRALARAQRRAWLGRAAAGEGNSPGDALAALDRDTERLAARDPWLRDWLAHDPSRAIGRVTMPVLVAHGAHDGQVPVAQAESLALLLRERGARSVEVRRLPGVNHLLLADERGDPLGYRRLPSRAIPAPVRDTLVAWLSARLRGPS